MGTPGAEILNLDDRLIVGARIEIDALATKIFEVLATPARHASFDGSGTLTRATSGPGRLYLGARFWMAMKIKVPYWISNEVVEFVENERIAWRHLMKWRWIYQLEDLGNGRTRVTELFDANPCNRAQVWWLGKTASLQRNPKWMAKSLVKLKTLCEA